MVKQEERQIQIYRYGLCTLVHYLAAKKLLGDENKARLLGVLLATTYATFKQRRPVSSPTKGGRPVPSPLMEATKEREDIEIVRFGGFDIALYPKGNPTTAWLVRYPLISATSDKFDNVMEKLDQSIKEMAKKSENPPFTSIEELSNIIENRLSSVSKNDLETQRVFEVYKNLRDDIEFGRIKGETLGTTGGEI